MIIVVPASRSWPCPDLLSLLIKLRERYVPMSCSFTREKHWINMQDAQQNETAYSFTCLQLPNAQKHFNIFQADKPLCCCSCPCSYLKIFPQCRSYLLGLKTRFGFLSFFIYKALAPNAKSAFVAIPSKKAMLAEPRSKSVKIMH